MSNGGTQRVALILVSHDGAGWLPTVIEGIRTQQRGLDQFVCIDTTSRDASVELLTEAFGDVVDVLPGSTGYPSAIKHALGRIGDDVEWVWLLHDDSTPTPETLANLLAAADRYPEASILGPKLREWPSLRRLLELGVTISGTGRRETGLERAEYDQGQHDEIRRVLAVNTAGMLVRREVLADLGGFDEQMPVFGNDLDFGWRAAAAGHQTIVVPDAVVFHAEAAHRGIRRTPLTGRHTHYQERRAALYTLLANVRARALPFQIIRLVLGTLLRMVGFLLVRAVGQALDELAALVSVLSQPNHLLTARRERQGRTVAQPRDVRRLLAPAWLPYRHGLDFITDLAGAVTNQAADVAERRRIAAAEADPASFAARRVAASLDDEFPDDTGLVARFVTNPVALLLAAFVLVTIVGARAAFGDIGGGGLSPAPARVGDWWHLYLQSWHPLGLGTAVPAPAYLLVLTLLGTVVGSAGGALTIVMVGAVPLGLWGAWRLLRVVGRLVSPQGLPRWLLLWGATTYALVPVASGAWSDGRLGPVVSAALLPWATHAALSFADPEPDRRWRAAWRTGLLLSVITAFTPVAWWFAVLLGVVVTVVGLRIVPGAVRQPATWTPPTVALAVPVALLAAWWIPALQHRAGEALLLDPGRLPGPVVGRGDLLIGRLGDLGAPPALGAILVVLAVAALLPRVSRIPVLVCWIAATASAVVALILSTITLDLAVVSVGPSLSFLMIAVQGAFVLAIVLGAQGAWTALIRERASHPAWKRAGLGLAGCAMAAVPMVATAWFAIGPDTRLDEPDPQAVPEYMVQSSEVDAARGILVLRGDVAQGLRYVVRRGDGDTLGDDEIVDQSAENTTFTRTVRTLVSRPTSKTVDALARAGIEYVVLAAPADGEVAAELDATSGLIQASAEDRDTRAWQVNRPVSDEVVHGERSWLRWFLLLEQFVGIVVVAVLAGPTRRREQTA